MAATVRELKIICLGPAPEGCEIPFFRPRPGAKHSIKRPVKLNVNTARLLSFRRAVNAIAKHTWAAKSNTAAGERGAVPCMGAG